MKKINSSTFSLSKKMKNFFAATWNLRTHFFFNWNRRMLFIEFFEYDCTLFKTKKRLSGFDVIIGIVIKILIS